MVHSMDGEFRYRFMLWTSVFSAQRIVSTIAFEEMLDLNYT